MDPLLTGEQAVLGAILIDPRQLSRLDWLEPRDFYRPAHRALFSALRKLRDDGEPVLDAEGEVPLEWLTATAAEAGRHVRGITPSYPHTLIAACPRPANAPVYGRMVLEASIHRTVAEHAARLLAIAREDTGQREIDGTLAQADVLAAVLDDLSRRWGTQPRTQAPTPGTSQPPAPAVAPVPAAQLEDEQFLLALLVNRGGAIEEVFDWLRPQDFADPGHGQLYRCVGALHHRGEAIDPVTVLWEVQRRGLLADGTLTQQQPTPLLGDGAAGSAEWLGEQLLRSSLTRAAAGAALQIAAHADDQRLTPGQLIGHALHTLGPLDDVRARWSKDLSPAAQQPLADQAARVSAALARSPQGKPGNRRLPVARTDPMRPRAADPSASPRQPGPPRSRAPPQHRLPSHTTCRSPPALTDGVSMRTTPTDWTRLSAPTFCATCTTTSTSCSAPGPRPQ
ncbi:DnaB-like helicase N-terminal domain-containing protein [Kitasatospora sp. LaBMicrA B282]|uniref:DnaB-like helicase N-terminal domain-containing protein n=1 Tax=Kitasatospora sp. LaBMicrA B282 TaxID=3420949 RepID=UPI003D0D8D55